MGDIRKRTLADDVRAARATPTRDTFEQGGFAGVAGKVAANVALIPSDYIEFIKTAPVVAAVGTAALGAPNTELGRQVYSKAAVTLQKASETSVPERIKYLAENPPDVTNAVVQIAGPNMAWKAARRLGYELLPQQVMLYARSLLQRKSLQTTLPKRANATIWDLVEHNAHYGNTVANIRILKEDPAVVNPEVLNVVKDVLKARLGQEVPESKILVFEYYRQMKRSVPITGKLLKKIAEKTGNNPEWVAEDNMFTSLNKFYAVKDGDDYHVVDLYKFFPLESDFEVGQHLAEMPPTKALIKSLLKGQLDAGGTQRGVMSVAQDLGVRHGAAFPVYWKITKPD